MWADNETTSDLLGFRVHVALLESVVTNPSLLPAVVGLFGDWGSGKSSIMKMLEERLNSDDYKDVACLYFNGWVFEGYQDAKSALLSSILVQLTKHKRFKDTAKDYAMGLLRRVKWMEIAKIGGKYVGLPLLAALVTGGTGAAAVLALSLGSKLLPSSAGEEKAGEKKSEDKKFELSDVLAVPDNDEIAAIREFRERFAEMLEKTSLSSLVILIDDLDRCLPERIIETLEAIKLFVSVPNTAFVIGADPRIVRHAIASRYSNSQLDATASGSEHYDLVNDYLEKLIQIPYHLPRLSPPEIESYINLLACTKFMTVEDSRAVIDTWGEYRRGNPHRAYRRTEITSALKGANLAAKLESQLSWSEAVSPVLTEGLKGNPRQIKRMLNSMLLRHELARVAGIDFKEDVLAKLMVLEYAHPKRFRDLNDWQAGQAGHPSELKALEEAALATPQGAVSEHLKEWQQSPSLNRWMTMSPALRTIDLRDYFWLARDKTSSTLAGVTMISPVVRRLLNDLLDGPRPKQHSAAKQAGSLDDTDRQALLELLEQRLQRHPAEEPAAEALLLLSNQKLPGAARALIAAVRAAGSRVSPSVPLKLGTLAANDPSLREEVRGTLVPIANDSAKTPTVEAAKKVIAKLD